MNRELLPFLIIIMMFGVAFLVEPHIYAEEGGKMALGWNAEGKPETYINKSVGLYLIPVLTLALYLGFLWISRLILRQHAAHIKDSFWGFNVVFVFVMATIYLSIIITSLRLWREINTMLIAISGIAIMSFYIGHALSAKEEKTKGKAHPKKEELLWERTNKIGSLLFWMCGIVALISLFLPADFRLWLILLPVTIVVVGIYAYFILDYLKIRKARNAEAPKKHAKL